MEQICQPALYIIMNDYDWEKYEKITERERKDRRQVPYHKNVLLQNMQPSEVWIRIDGSRLILIACKHTFDMEQASLSSSGAQFLSGENAITQLQAHTMNFLAFNKLHD